MWSWKALKQIPKINQTIVFKAESFAIEKAARIIETRNPSSSILTSCVGSQCWELILLRQIKEHLHHIRWHNTRI